MLRTLRLQGISAAVVALAMAWTTPTNAQTTFDVELINNQFAYDGASNTRIDLTIQLGDTVRWTWVNGNHNVVSGEFGISDSLFSSGSPTNIVGTTFEYTFDDLGMFSYFCVPHEVIGMASSIMVVPVPEPSTLAGLLTLAGMLMAGRRRGRR